MEPGPLPPQATGFLGLPPEIQTFIFFALPNMQATIALRVTCKQFSSIYQRSKTRILVAQRERITVPFTELYELLERLWLPDGAVLHPPPGGWPNIAIEDSAIWGKSPFAMDILRHMPYIDYKGQYDRMFIGFRATVVNYTHRRPQEWAIVAAERYLLKTLKATSEFKGEIPPITTTKHIIKITKPKFFHQEALYLDTFSGLVYRYGPRKHPEGVAAHDYCDAKIEAFTSLDEIFVPGILPPITLSRWGEEAAKNKTYDAEETERQGEPQVDNEADGWTRDHALQARQLHRKYGWPGQNWEKEACLDEVHMILGCW